jgi:hypothetical protein
VLSRETTVPRQFSQIDGSPHFILKLSSEATFLLLLEFHSMLFLLDWAPGIRSYKAATSAPATPFLLCLLAIPLNHSSPSLPANCKPGLGSARGSLPFCLTANGKSLRTRYLTNQLALQHSKGIQACHASAISPSDIPLSIT